MIQQLDLLILVVLILDVLLLEQLLSRLVLDIFINQRIDSFLKGELRFEKKIFFFAIKYMPTLKKIYVLYYNWQLIGKNNQ